jgi:hypothetical protein
MLPNFFVRVAIDVLKGELGPDARSSQILSDTPQPFEKLVGVDCMKCER